MEQTAWGLGLIIVCASVAVQAADHGDAAWPTKSNRHHKIHKPVRHVEPAEADDGSGDAAEAGKSPQPQAQPPSGKPDSLVVPPASAMPEGPALNANGAVMPLAPPPAEAPAALAPPQPNDTVEAIEAVEAEPVAAAGWFTDADPVFDRVFDQYTAQTVRRGTVNSFISHRNREGILRGPFYDLLGFDGGGLKIGLSVRYGVLDDLDVGVYRQNGTTEIFDTWEFDGRYQILKEAADMPLSLGVRAGLTWFSASGNNALAGFAEAMVNKRVAPALLVGVNLLYHSNSSSPTKRSHDSKGTGGIGVMAEWRLLDYLSVGAEVTVGVVGYHQTYPAITVGPKFITNRHTFAISISNTQSETTDSIITNTWRSNAKDWLLGFNISREM